MTSACLDLVVLMSVHMTCGMYQYSFAQINTLVLLQPQLSFSLLAVQLIET